MSSKAFHNKLNTYKSDITGEEKEYTVNNYMWLVLKEEHGLTQEQYDKQLGSEEILTLAKVSHAILKANGVDATLEDVLKNTDPTTLLEFYQGFFELAYPDLAAQQKAVQEAVKQANENIAKKK